MPKFTLRYTVHASVPVDVEVEMVEGESAFESAHETQIKADNLIISHGADVLKTATGRVDHALVEKLKSEGLTVHTDYRDSEAEGDDPQIAVTRLRFEPDVKQLEALFADVPQIQTDPSF